MTDERIDVHVFGVTLGTCSKAEGVDPVDLQYCDFKPNPKFTSHFPQVDESIHLFVDIYSGNFIVYGGASSERLLKVSIIHTMTQIYKQIGKDL